MTRRSSGRLMLRTGPDSCCILSLPGTVSLWGEQQRMATERREAISRTRGALTGLYGRGYLEELREDWLS